MNKRIRQYVGLISAVLAYYIIHEGAHLLYALIIGVFKKINFIGLGIQIDVYSEKMTDSQMGIFCLLGAAATLLIGYLLTIFSKTIIKLKSNPIKACLFYITIALLFIDPIYLSVFCEFVGGGDMNGISLIVPKIAAIIVFAVLLVINAVIFIKYVIPKYKEGFIDN